MVMGNEQPAAGPEPLFRVVRGQPTHEEVAALAAALTAKRAAAARQAGAAAPVSTWACRGDLLRAPLAPGRDAWRRSLRPGPLR